jgi:hypothetical protein
MYLVLLESGESPLSLDIEFGSLCILGEKLKNFACPTFNSGKSLEF